MIHNMEDIPLHDAHRIVTEYQAEGEAAGNPIAPWSEEEVQGLQNSYQKVYDLEKKELGQVPQPQLSTALLSRNLPAVSFASRAVLYESMLVFLQHTCFILYWPRERYIKKLLDFLHQFPAKQGLLSIRVLEIRFLFPAQFKSYDQDLDFLEELTGLRRIVVRNYDISELFHGTLSFDEALKTIDEFREEHQGHQFFSLYKANGRKELVVYIHRHDDCDDHNRGPAIAMLLEVLKEERDSYGEGVKILPVLLEKHIMDETVTTTLDTI